MPRDRRKAEDHPTVKEGRKNKQSVSQPGSSQIDDEWEKRENGNTCTLLLEGYPLLRRRNKKGHHRVTKYRNCKPEGENPRIKKRKK